MATSSPPLPVAANRADLDWIIYAPALLSAALVVILAGAASLSVPIQHVTAPLAWLLAAAGFAGFCWWHRVPVASPLVWLVGAAVVAGWLTMANCEGRFWPTAAGLLSPRMDAWSYQALSDYLRRFPRGQLDGMPMVDEFGSHLAGARFASAALLAFLQGLPGLSGVAATHLVFVAGCLWTHFFSMLALGRALNRRADWGVPLLGAFLATAGGWLSDAIDLSNNDHLVFAALAPALLALLCPRPDNFFTGRRVVGAGGAVLAALLYTYPEGVVLLGVLALPLAVAILRPGRWREAVGAGVLGALLAAPYLPVFFTFFRAQMAAGLNATAVRPYEGVFPGLLGPYRLAAAFALGEELQGSVSGLTGLLVPLVLCVLLGLGARALGRRQAWFPWVALPVAALLLWQNAGKHYDYGTYKILACAAWWIYPAISAGAFWLCRRFAWPWPVRAGALALLLGAIGGQKLYHRAAFPPMPDDRLRPLSELASVHFVTGQAPVLLSLDDDMDHVWATYYLRGLPLATWHQRGYLSMAHITPLLARGIAPSPESCAFMLVSGARPDALWRNSRFSLVPLSKLYIAGIDNPPNGVEAYGAERLLWLGTQAATLQIVAQTAGDFELRATAFGLGPSLPSRTNAAVEITDAGGRHVEQVITTTRSLPLHLAPGNNAVRLHVLGSPELGSHNNDARELMLGIVGPKVAPRDR